MLDKSTVDAYHESALDAAFFTYTQYWPKEDREALRERLKTPPRYWDTPTIHHRAQIAKLAIKGLQGSRDAQGQAILKELWEVAANGYFLCDGTGGNEYNSVEEWVETELSSEETDVDDTGDELVTDDYFLRLARVVDRILLDVQRWEASHVLFDRDGGPITAERLLYTPGLLKRLLRASYTYKDLTDLTDKRALLDAVLFANSTATVARLCDQLQGKVLGHLRYPFFEVEVGEDQYDLTVKGMKSQDLRIAKKLLRGMLASV